MLDAWCVNFSASDGSIYSSSGWVRGALSAIRVRAKRSSTATATQKLSGEHFLVRQTSLQAGRRDSQNVEKILQ